MFIPSYFNHSNTKYILTCINTHSGNRLSVTAETNTYSLPYVCSGWGYTQSVEKKMNGKYFYSALSHSEDSKALLHDYITPFSHSHMVVSLHCSHSCLAAVWQKTAPVRQLCTGVTWPFDHQQTRRVKCLENWNKDWDWSSNTLVTGQTHTFCFI